MKIFCFSFYIIFLSFCALSFSILLKLSLITPPPPIPQVTRVCCNNLFLEAMSGQRSRVLGAWERQRTDVKCRGFKLPTCGFYHSRRGQGQPVLASWSIQGRNKSIKSLTRRSRHRWSSAARPGSVSHNTVDRQTESFVGRISVTFIQGLVVEAPVFLFKWAWVIYSRRCGDHLETQALGRPENRLSWFTSLSSV